SRSVHKTSQEIASENFFTDFVEKHGPTEFLGYTRMFADGVIKGLVVDGAFVQEMHAGQEGLVILDKTPFYPEMGGQIGDTGIISDHHSTFIVKNSEAPYKGIIAHVGTVDKGALKVGQPITASIDHARRQKIANNHTATHLLHWALHQILGEHVKQAGSVVDQSRLRFDFNHHKALTLQEIHKIEDLINKKIRENAPVNSYELSYEDAQKRQDIKQFFGEKYGSVVRVIDIDYSKELCGGTHTHAVGNIGLFRVAKEGSIAAGVRRIEAVTGEEAELLGRQSDVTINSIAEALKTQPAKVMERIEKMIEENKELAAQIKAAKKGVLADMAANLVLKAEVVKGDRLIAAELSVAPDELRIVADEVMAKFPSGILVLAAQNDGKCSMIVRVSDDLVGKGKKAIEIVQALAPIIEGTGGGKANNAQAGGKAPHKIAEALSAARGLV
ncbi:MAG: alanine--tRNA ligase-related protein, partial [Parachlamydiaceae bacterium]